MKGVKELHARLITSNRHRDSLSVSPVIKAYALSHSHSHLNLRKARSAFDQLDRPTLPLFNHMIRGLSQSDEPNEAIRLYHRMTRKDSIFGDSSTFIFVLKACSRVSDVLVGKGVHVRAVKLGFESYLYVSNALVHFYGSCGVLSLARKVFDEMPQRDSVSWNSLICGYTKWNLFKDVLSLFDDMRESGLRPDSVTIMKVVLACSYLREHEKADSLVKYVESNRIVVNVYLGNTMIDMYARRGLVKLARRVFEEMRERNVVSWNAMMMGYMNSGDLSGARLIFDEMPKRDVVSWTSMITANSQSGRHSEAVNLFREMMTSDVKPDKITLASVLSACAHLGSLEIGEAIHDVVKNHKELKPDICVGNALIDMYFKCGSAEKALMVFGEMKEKDDVTWTSAISGSAVNGFANSSVELFSRMLREGTKPSHGSFVGILLACAHTGLVEKGLSYFESMEKIYKLKPEMKHYGCVVDMLGRSGNLEKAIEFINNMPVKPNAVVWRTLLSSCKLYGDVGLAEFVTKKLLEFEACNTGDFVLSSNTYASVNRWDDSAEIRDRMHASDLQRPLGFSFTETNG